MMPSITLYHFPGASSIFPYLLLEYSGIQYDVKISNPSDPDFAATNPKKQVPVLLIDGEAITENPAIAHAINQLAPEKQIFGRTPMEFVRVCEWLNFLSATVHAQTWGPYVRPWRFTEDSTAEAGIKAVAQEKLKQRWEAIESALREGCWAVGDGVTAVDGFLVQFMRFAKNGMGLDVNTLYPKFTALVDKVLGVEELGKVYERDEQMKKEMGGLKVK